MRYHAQESRPRRYRPCNNEHRPDLRLPPLRLKHLAASKEIRNGIAEARLAAEGYKPCPVTDIWSKQGEPDCCVKDGYVLALTPSSVRHLSNSSRI